jgi:tRNA(Ile)-lysidine synthase TilS/MesJ
MRNVLFADHRDNQIGEWKYFHLPPSLLPPLISLSLSHLHTPPETMVSRLRRNRGIDGLAGMYMLTRISSFPDIQIIRPLLQCHKAELLQVCREAGLEWIEEDAVRPQQGVGNKIRQLLSQDPELTEGLDHMFMSFSQTREAMTSAGTYWDLYYM